MVPQNGGFIRENPINMDDLGVYTSKETFIWVSSEFSPQFYDLWALHPRTGNMTGY